MEAALYTYTEPDGTLHCTVTPGDPDDEGIMWVHGRHNATDPEILALLAARALLSQGRTWTTGDGRVLPVHELHDNHIVYALRKFARGAVDPDRARQLSYLRDEAKCRNLEVDP